MDRRKDATVSGKWRDERGETLVEVVASVLIMTLSVLLLFSAVMVSVRINKSAKGSDEEFYSALNAAEGQSTPAPTGIVPTGSKVTVKQEQPASAATSVEVEVDFYGGEGALSYQYSPTPPPAGP